MSEYLTIHRANDRCTGICETPYCTATVIVRMPNIPNTAAPPHATADTCGNSNPLTTIHSNAMSTTPDQAQAVFTASGTDSVLRTNTLDNANATPDESASPSASGIQSDCRLR